MWKDPIETGGGLKSKPEVKQGRQIVDTEICL